LIWERKRRKLGQKPTLGIAWKPDIDKGLPLKSKVAQLLNASTDSGTRVGSFSQSF
jgi:hypothetical protein